MRFRTAILALLGGAALPAGLCAQTPSAPQAWVVRSDSYTQLLIDLDKKYSPEYGSSQGLAEYDTKVSVPTIDNDLAKRKEEEAILRKYQAALTAEKDPFVLQDLQILIGRIGLDFRRQDYELKKEVPFLNAATTISDGLEALLDDQTSAARRQAAVVRIKEYAGLINHYRPITAVFQERVMHQMQLGPDMIYPSRQHMEVDLGRDAIVMDGIPELCKKYQLKGWEKAYAELRRQVDAYDQWTKEQVLPKARQDFRLPAESYAIGLAEFGIDIPPAELTEKAHAAFAEIQEAMKPIAAQIAAARHLPSSDYRDVIHELKKAQVHGDSIMLLYERHLKDIEQIIREHRLVSLPGRPAIIRLATAAETAKGPAPHMVPPPFLNNTGQRGVFVLPLNMPPAPGETADRYDDFTFDAASWTLIAHEARPGHELQFDKMVEEGVSNARAIYAFNSTNAEGWGLYAEYITLPYMPLEGQLISLDYRLLRAARAFLDPELQSGKMTQDSALQILMKDVVQSHAMATQEVQRYTLRMPGQATSYFYGYMRMIQLRKEAEAALGDTFSALKFHDFILSQGLLTPDLIRDAVMNRWVPSQK